MTEDQKKERAAKLTVADVMAEVAGWGDSGGDEQLRALVEIISLAPKRKKLFDVLRGVLPSDERRQFADVVWESVSPGSAFVFFTMDDLIDAMNKRCAVVWREDSIEFVFWKDDGAPILLDKKYAAIALAQYQAFLTVNNEEEEEEEEAESNTSGKKKKKKKKKKKTIEVPGFQTWVKSPYRREYLGMGMYPDAKECPHGYLNLWTGFAIEPAPEGVGDWSLLRTHLKENVCSDNEEHHEYFLDLLSQLFVEPWRKSEIITAIRGEPGTGKTKVGEWVCKIIGKRHSLVIDKGYHLTGHFNGHLEIKLLVQAEEAAYAGNPENAEALKHLGTSHDFTYESKGYDARGGDNYTRVIMTTNKDWAAPVEAGDRRYLVVDCASTHKEDKPYFAAIDKQMKNGGAAAMHRDLLARGMTFAKLGKPPMTVAKQDQIRYGMKQQMKWLASVLNDCQFAYKEKGEEKFVLWPDAGGTVAKSIILSSYRDVVPGHKGSATSEELGIFLRKRVPGLGVTKVTDYGQRVPHYVLPPLEKARAAFIEAVPGYAFEVDVPDTSDKKPANDGEAEATASDDPAQAMGTESAVEAVTDVESEATTSIDPAQAAGSDVEPAPTTSDDPDSSPGANVTQFRKRGKF